MFEQSPPDQSSAKRTRLSPRPEIDLGDIPGFKNLLRLAGCGRLGCLLPFLIIPICFFLFAFSELNVRGMLGRSGVSTSGTVIQHRSVESVVSPRGTRSYAYYVMFQFYAGEPKQDNSNLYTVEQQVSKPFFDHVIDGSTLQITYLPSNPDSARILDENGAVYWVLLLGSVLMFVIIVFVMFRRVL